MTSADSDSGWSTSAIAYGLHELGHIWMIDHLDHDTEEAFADHCGLAAWHDVKVPWGERGVEHAGFTLAWGLAGSVDARYPIGFPPPDCEELATRYELLTGRAPLTACGESGWTP